MFKPFLYLTLSLAFSGHAYAQTSFQTEAPHAVIIDAASGEVLFEKDARQPMPPASMTKIMTAQMVFEALEAGTLSPATEFVVSEDAWRRGGFASGSSTMALDLNSKVSVENLIKGVIIQSGNDACIVLAEGMVGSETAFAERMTARAREMGLDSATFRNATGWPHPEHRISALDLAKLAQKQILQFPQYYPIYAETEFTWNGVRQFNRNPILGRVTGADGLKTGSTSEAGYGLVGSAKRGDDRRIIVINGLESAADRRDVATRLMEAAFLQFRVYDLHSQGETLAEVDIFMGNSEKVGVALTQDIRKGMPISDRNSVTTSVKYVTLAAPITKGDKVAELEVKIPGRPVETYDLVAIEDVARKGLFARAWSGLMIKLRG
ncbi:D-alanyl-D-alanine carboxypeptidase family protein [Litorimonas sp. WD9-15]|uniref:D-alanyl-D-alanine carboxypeptidase family protein n=1 Tax=Litorimonas sp. WD9-15 TaxID=3418716 RepID=UPI003CFD6FE0